MTPDVGTWLDERTEQALQPPCDMRRGLEFNPCPGTASHIARVTCKAAHARVRLWCGSCIAASALGRFCCADCFEAGDHDARLAVLSVAPLRPTTQFGRAADRQQTRPTTKPQQGRPDRHDQYRRT